MKLNSPLEMSLPLMVRGLMKDSSMPVSRANERTATMSTKMTPSTTKKRPALRLRLPLTIASSFLSRFISVGISLVTAAGSSALAPFLSGSEGSTGALTASPDLPVRSSGSISARSFRVTPFAFRQRVSP